MTSTSPKNGRRRSATPLYLLLRSSTSRTVSFAVVIKRTRLGLSINARNRIRVELMVENTAICSCVAFSCRSGSSTLAITCSTPSSFACSANSKFCSSCLLQQQRGLHEMLFVQLMMQL